MAWLVGIILVAMAAGSIIGVMYMVLREHQETEEWYIPPAPGTQPETDDGE